ncbi:hypothetical protein PAND9192_01054 [Photobacterium andalusiense]|jgi:hypothetical protein|uniref:Uncharacterized protein n=1 Tax=Photobacterium andalusiense TaxID=2204296 RepID=A0A1Y6MCR1_9GAMM|nr:hypothetical protein PAND9192_01054 [Photobacterium andalusiense]
MFGLYNNYKMNKNDDRSADLSLLTERNNTEALKYMLRILFLGVILYFI